MDFMWYVQPKRFQPPLTKVVKPDSGNIKKHDWTFGDSGNNPDVPSLYLRRYLRFCIRCEVKRTSMAAALYYSRLGVSFETCPLAQNQHPLGMEGYPVETLILTLHSWEEDIEGLEVGSVLGQHTFSVPTSDISVNETRNDHGMVFDPPGTDGREPLWPFGIFYKESVDTHTIEPLVLRISTQGKKTHADFTRLSSWKHTQGFTLMDSVFVGWNLRHHIESGGLEITLKQRENNVLYTSFQCDPKLNQNMLWVTAKKVD